MSQLGGHPWWLLPLNVGAWGVVHASTGYLAHSFPVEWCTRDNWLTHIRQPARTERRCRFFGVPRWKDSLPEAGALFAGGVSKRHLGGTSDDSLLSFAALTRRAEMAHWMAFLAAPLFFFWNPAWIGLIMVGYGALVNAPFIAIQRYNRSRVLRILSRRGASALGSSDSWR